MKKSKAKSAVTDAPLQETGPLPVGEAMRVPWAKIRPDPNQPRKTFNVESLRELAGSILQQGIVQPLILELVPAGFKIIEPELHCAEYQLLKATPGDDIPWTQMDRCDEKNFKLLRESWAGNFGGLGTEQDYQEHYRIVCGERRWRAAELVNLNEVPAMVYRGLTEQQRFGFQFVENNQRENISALEEAAALKQQLDERKLKDPTFSPEKLAMELSMSRAAMYERLKLTRLHGPIREALLAGTISTSIAGEIAKLPTPKAQEDILKEIEQKAKYGHQYSVREIQTLTDDRMKQLSDAPFNQNDAMLFAAAGTCVNCPFRTGNMLEQFPELKSRPNVCTNPACYDQKCKAYYQAEADKLGAKGTKILTAKEYKRDRAQYVEPDEYITLSKDWAPWSKHLGKKAPAAVMVVSEAGLKPVYPKEAALEVAAAKGLKPRADNTDVMTPEQRTKAAEKDKQERAEAEAKTERREKLVVELLPKMAKCLENVKDKDAWEITSKRIGGMNGYRWMPMEDLVDHTKTAKAAVLAAVLADEEEAVIDHLGNWNAPGVAQWKDLGVDLEAEDAKRATVETLPLKKAAPKQKELLDVPATKRGRGRPPGAKNKKGIK